MWVELFTTSELQLIVADLNLHIKAADGLFSNLDSDTWIKPQTPQKNTNLYGSMSVLQHDVTLTLDQASKFPRTAGLDGSAVILFTLTTGQDGTSMNCKFVGNLCRSCQIKCH